MNLGPLSDMHPVEQAIRDYVDRLTCIEEEGCVKTGAAVLAVLDLHKPRLRGGRKYEHDPIHYDCAYCWSIAAGRRMYYPCETVERVADALGVTP